MAHVDQPCRYRPRCGQHDSRRRPAHRHLYLPALQGSQFAQSGFLHPDSQAGRRSRRRHGQRHLSVRGFCSRSAVLLACQSASPRASTSPSSDAAASWPISSASPPMCSTACPRSSWASPIYSLIVLPQKHFSALSGGVALGIMMIPTITRTTEEMLLMVPHAIREAALGLGVPNWRSVLCPSRSRLHRPASSPDACWPSRASPVKQRRFSLPPSATSSGAPTSTSPSPRCRCRFTSTPSLPMTSGTAWHGPARWS